MAIAKTAGRIAKAAGTIAKIAGRNAKVAGTIAGAARTIGIGACLSSIVSCAASGAARDALERHEFSQLHMGVRVRIVAYARSEREALEACTAAFRRFAELDDSMSDYRPASELMRLCARAGGPPVEVGEDLWIVLASALALARESGGAFDPTAGACMRLWREARRTGRLPEPAEIDAALAVSGWRSVHMDPERRTVALAKPGMQLDLGGIAKGYAVDQALAALRGHGIERALVEAGGEIGALAPPPGERGWRVALDGGSTFLLANAALSTSGDAEQHFVAGGQRFSHVVDP
ncbi:MAG TPA: FAD:protein FMN transferase, partial [Planctomycetota bacterium]|nr:FAD:protein FMN transferase [Planctomycetota bacterium]